MRKVAGLLALFSISLFAADALTYPTSRTVDQSDDYHGTSVADPYRWLEDANSAETAEWVKAQNKVTFGFLEAIPQREQLKKRLTELWNFERYSAPRKEGGRYFFAKNNGLQNQSVHYVTEGLDGEARVLLDPNTLSADGTVSVHGPVVSDDGKKIAYGLAQSGSDWVEWRFRDVDTGRDLPDILKWTKFGGPAWSPDNSGVYYGRFDEPKENTKLQDTNYFKKLYFHKLGTPQSDDKLILKDDKNKEWSFYGGPTEDGKFLIVSISAASNSKNKIWIQRLDKDNAPFIKLVDNFDHSFDFIGNKGGDLYFVTDDGAPRGRVVMAKLGKDSAAFEQIIPQGPDKISSVQYINNQLVVSYLKDAQTAVKVFTLDGEFVHDIELPGIGTARGFGGKQKDKETFYVFTSYTTPSAIYRLDLKTGRSTLFRKSNVKFNADDFESKQVFFKSKDGARVPMFVTHKKGMKLDGNNPTYLYGYGGFDIPLTPGFSVGYVAWMEMGGVIAVANLRGGGEYGEEWHNAGRRDKKQNVFNDFIGAAEWLIANKYTSSPKLAIGGGSNGGLLVGACMTQRPDLFGAAIPEVGVMDMLRFHKFTIGWAWADEYGSSDKPDQFKTLFAYSPYHNLKKGTKYPATMVMTADHDDRVVPGHSFKFAAALQAAQSGPAPTIIRIESKAGHGAGTPTKKIIETAADRWAFLAKVLAM